MLARILVVAACSKGPNGSVSRTVVIHGVTFVTSIAPALAITAEVFDGSGKSTGSAYAVLGDSGGQQTVGGPVPGQRLSLQLAAGADVWLQEGTAPAQLVQSHDLRGLAGANVTGKLELRGGTPVVTVAAAPGDSFQVELHEGKLRVQPQTR